MEAFVAWWENVGKSSLKNRLITQPGLKADSINPFVNSKLHRRRRPQTPKGKEVRAQNLIKRPGDTKTDIAVPAVGVVPKAIRRSHMHGLVLPGSTAQHAPITVTA